MSIYIHGEGETRDLLQGLCGDSSNASLVVNLGSESIPDYPKILNRRLHLNKKKAHIYLFLHGMNVPQYYPVDYEIPLKKYPVLARRNNHSQGRDIVFIKKKGGGKNEV